MRRWRDCPDAEEHGWPFDDGRVIEGHPAWDCPHCEGGGTIAVDPEPIEVEAPGIWIKVQQSTGAVGVYAYDCGDEVVMTAEDAFKAAIALARAAEMVGFDLPHPLKVMIEAKDVDTVNRGQNLIR